jgi:hypothetical protein
MMQVRKYNVLFCAIICAIVISSTECVAQELGENAKISKVIDFFDVYNADLRSVFKQLSEYSGRYCCR